MEDTSRKLLDGKGSTSAYQVLSQGYMDLYKQIKERIEKEVAEKGSCILETIEKSPVGILAELVSDNSKVVLPKNLRMSISLQEVTADWEERWPGNFEYTPEHKVLADSSSETTRLSYILPTEVPSWTELGFPELDKSK